MCSELLTPLQFLADGLPRHSNTHLAVLRGALGGKPGNGGTWRRGGFQVPEAVPLDQDLSTVVHRQCGIRIL